MIRSVTDKHLSTELISLSSKPVDVKFYPETDTSGYLCLIDSNATLSLYKIEEIHQSARQTMITNLNLKTPIISLPPGKQGQMEGLHQDSLSTADLLCAYFLDKHLRAALICSSIVVTELILNSHQPVACIYGRVWEQLSALTCLRLGSRILAEVILPVKLMYVLVHKPETMVQEEKPKGAKDVKHKKKAPEADDFFYVLALDASGVLHVIPYSSATHTFFEPIEVTLAPLGSTPLFFDTILLPVNGILTNCYVVQLQVKGSIRTLFLHPKFSVHSVQLCILEAKDLTDYGQLVRIRQPTTKELVAILKSTDNELSAQLVYFSLQKSEDVYFALGTSPTLISSFFGPPLRMLFNEYNPLNRQVRMQLMLL